MTPLSLQELDFDVDLEARAAERELVTAWRTEQLHRLGLPKALALAFADVVDWHELAALVERGCPPLVALEIVH